jgi:hypothetical protein
MLSGIELPQTEFRQVDGIVRRFILYYINVYLLVYFDGDISRILRHREVVGMGIQILGSNYLLKLNSLGSVQHREYNSINCWNLQNIKVAQTAIKI